MWMFHCYNKKGTQMAKYVLNLTKPHAESMIELINNDNAGTIVEPLTLAKYELTGLRDVLPADNLTSARTHAVTVVNKAVPTDTVEVFFNKVALTDIVTMTAAGKDFDWYDPDTWDDSTSPALAITALKAACTRDGVDAVAVLGDITVTRVQNQETNHFELVFSYTSHVMHTGAKFQMPKHFSETITTTDLVGFIYQPIAPESVVE